MKKLTVKDIKKKIVEHKYKIELLNIELESIAVNELFDKPQETSRVI
jgi:hypothetical protein